MSLNVLPNELIECIAINLNYIDLSNLSQVNVRLNSFLSNCNGLWQKALRKRWPTLYEAIFERLEIKSEMNWRFETIQCHLIGVNVYKELCQMSARCHRKNELSEKHFDSFRGMATENRFHCVIDELETILNSGDKKKHNLTIKFYARKVLRSLRTEFVVEKWAKMVQALNYNQFVPDALPVDVLQPDERDVPGDLITGSVLIAQYCQPNSTIEETKIRQNIREIALNAVQILRERYPKNSFITQRDGELLTDLEASKLTESITSEPKDCIEIIHALNAAMYEGASPFRGNRYGYYSPTNSYIDKVLELKLGIPILLCILYQAVAALLGVKLFPISHPGHFMLAIRDKLHVPEVNHQFTFIDPFNDGKLSDQPVNVVPQFAYSNDLVAPSRPLSVFFRMVNNLIEIGRVEMQNSKGVNTMRNAMELANLIYKEDNTLKYVLAQLYLSLDINHERILQLAQQVGARARDVFVNEVTIKMAAVEAPIVVKHRSNVSDDVQFAIGIVMRDLKLKSICVVIGWAKGCDEWSKWKAQMGQNYPLEGENQAVYKVFLDDGSTRYTAQEYLSIELDSNRKIEEMFPTEIGRYFIGFNGRNYELNEEIRAAYPDDEGALDDIYRKHSTSGFGHPV